jgi:hypothetical protein
MFVTKCDVDYCMGVHWGAHLTIIPKGTKVYRTPISAGYYTENKYYAEPWEGMSEEEIEFSDKYRFILTDNEVERVPFTSMTTKQFWDSMDLIERTNEVLYIDNISSYGKNWEELNSTEQFIVSKTLQIFKFKEDK